MARGAPEVRDLEEEQNEREADFVGAHSGQPRAEGTEGSPPEGAVPAGERAVREGAKRPGLRYPQGQTLIMWQLYR